MAKNRKRNQARQLDVEDMIRLVDSMSSIKNGNGHSPAPLDPSVNVKERVELQADFDKERRDSDKDWQRRLDAERQRADVAMREAEAGRIDAKFADVVQSALLAQQATTTAATTLATTLATATETLRKSQETTDLATRAAIRSVEQNQAQGAGGAAQLRDTRQTRQWETGIYGSIGLAAALGLARLLGWIH